MSEFAWRNGLGLGLVVGMGAICVALVWGGALYRHGKCLSIGDCDHASSITADNAASDFWWWKWQGSFVSSSDSLAQWIIALLTILAVGLLWRTLIQTNKTNESALTAAIAANEANIITRMEQRPWVTFERDVLCDVHHSNFGISISWNKDLVNKGKIPAYMIKDDWMVVRRGHIQKLDVEAAAFADRCVKRRGFSSITVIFPGEKACLMRYVYDGTAAFEYDQRDTAETKGGYVIMFICVTYRLSLHTEDVGAEVIVVGFENDGNYLGPYRTKMLEYANARHIR